MLSGMPRGFTLVELLLVITLMTLGTAIALPRLARAAGETDLHQEAARMVTALGEARATAIRLGVPARLTLGDSTYAVDATIAGTVTRVWQMPGPAFRGIVITGAGAPLAFAPSGLAMGAANRTVHLSQGAAERTVVISRLGRLTW